MPPKPALFKISCAMLHFARLAEKQSGKVYRFAGEGQSLLMTSEQGI